MQLTTIKIQVCVLKSYVKHLLLKIIPGQTQTHTSSFTSPIDSAIGSAMGSGFSTKAPSIVADDDLDNDDITGMFTWDPQQYNQQQMQGMVACLTFCLQYKCVNKAMLVELNQNDC